MKRMLHRFSIPVALVLFTAIFCLGQDQQAAASGNQPTTAQPTDATQARPQFSPHDQRYRIFAGDVFDIAFDLSPEFNQTAVSVQPDGFITLRGVGDIKVEGQTMSEVRETIRTAYGKILHDPIISITLKDFQKPFFVADGQVGHPGKYDLHGPVTLTEAIAIAGGFQESAKHSQVLLYHRINDQWTEARLFNIKDMEKRGNLTEDPSLSPGDMIFVPKNRLSKVRQFIPTSNVGVAAYNTPF